MKKIYIILIIISLTIIVLLLGENNKTIKYNNLKLAITVNGSEVTSMPSGNYYLVNYTCNNNETKLVWDRNTGSISTSVKEITDVCSLEFKSVPKLSELVSIGDYISYTGNNGCTTSACSGFNFNQNNDTTSGSYGYCSSTQYEFYTYGWRVAYILDDSVYIVAAGSPECLTAPYNDPTTFIGDLKTASLKYCNTDYLQGGICDDTTAHPIRGGDFYNITKGLFGESGARYLYNYDDTANNGDGIVGDNYCYDTYSLKECGYNNDLIDNGGHYWFGSAYSKSAMLRWLPMYPNVMGQSNSETDTFGLRPVLKLDSTITVTGGSGIMEEPYTISKRSGV